MTNLKNQTRAALYLLHRNIWPKVALIAMLAIAFGPICADTMLIAGPDGTARRVLDFTTFLVNATHALPFCACLVSAGLVSADLARGGARGAVLSQDGRRCYVASRLIAPALVVLALEALLAVLCLAVYLVGGALGLVAILDGPEYFAAQLVQCVVPRLLLSYAYLCLAALAEWLTRSGANALGVAALFGIGLVGVLVFLVPLWLGNLLGLGSALGLAVQGWLPVFQVNSASPTLGLADPNIFRALITAPACVALCYLAAQRLWARRPA